VTKREPGPSRRVAKASRLWSDASGGGLSSAQSGSVALRGTAERGLWTAWSIDTNGTREAAVCLVAESRLPYELTVDLICAGIRQGSRTMINDELKLWKDEQARIDTLSASLLPAVANTTVSVWAFAVEHGEQVFAQRDDELETEAPAEVRCAASVATAKAGPQAEGHTLRANSRISRHALPRRWPILPVPKLGEMPPPG
jgi:hypothetical protein